MTVQSRSSFLSDRQGLSEAAHDFFARLNNCQLLQNATFECTLKKKTLEEGISEISAVAILVLESSLAQVAHGVCHSSAANATVNNHFLLLMHENEDITAKSFFLFIHSQVFWRKCKLTAKVLINELQTGSFKSGPNSRLFFF